VKKLRFPVRWVRGVLPVLIALLLLSWALHDVELGRVLEQVRDVRILPLVVAVVLITIGHFPIRVIRWRVILRPQGRTLAFTPLFHATASGTLMNYLLPARLGELVRAYAARELTTSPFSTAIGSLMAERVVDGFAMCLLLFGAIAVGGFQNAVAVGTWTVGRVALVAGGVFGLGMLALVLLALRPRHLRSVAGRLLGDGDAGSWMTSVRGTIRGIVAGLDALRSVNRTVGIVFWTLVLWSLSACGIWVGLRAFGIVVPLTVAALLQALVALAIALPSAPGFVGPFQAAARVALSLGGIDATQAIAFSLPFHVIAFFVPVTVIGVWSLSRTGMRFAQLGERARSAEG
jgi:uncharacterized protein (TIRG00374 family)